jgi:hypothetical protein
MWWTQQQTELLKQGKNWNDDEPHNVTENQTATCI